MMLPPFPCGRFSAFAVLLGVTVLLLLAVPGPWAGPTIYTYVDDEGTVIFTEQLQRIPERYRDRVRVMADTEGQKAKEPKEKKALPPHLAPVSEMLGAATPQAPKETAAAVERAREVARDIQSGPQSLIPTFSPYQTAVLGMGFGVAVILFVMMKLSHNLGVRLILRLLLVAVIFGTSYLVYFSGLGEKFAEMTGHATQAGPGGGGSKLQSPTELLQKVRETVKEMERSQQEKVNALQQMEKEP